MRAYYNEIDPFAIGVLKRRIADGSLPPGEVDDRDIRSVQAADLRGYAQVHLFAGIGGFGLAARLAGWPDGRALWTGGYPCQPFSVAGMRRGMSDDRYLWPDIARLLGSVEARPAWCLFENVDGHRDLGLDRTLFDLEALGYAGRPFWIPACAVGAPHDRMRVWIAAQSLDDAAGARCAGPGRSPALAALRGQAWRGEPAGRGGDGGVELADTQGQRGDGGEAAAGAQGRAVAQGDGAVGPLAHAPGVFGRTVLGDEPDGDVPGGAFGLADAGDRQLPLARRRAQGRDGPRSAGPALGQLVDAARQRRGEGRAAPGLRGGRATAPGPGGRDGDPWGDAIWAACADGKLRRTQPGLGLLAHGVSERVARLRALGNAIVPQVAARILAAILASEADR